MGNLNKFNLKKIREDFNINTLVETGTYKGYSVNLALKYGFKKILSVDIFEDYYNLAKETFKEYNVKLFFGKSVDKLPEMLQELYKDENVLFWLDAHLPSVHGCGEYSLEVEFPLEDELKVILKNRDTRGDYFLIDDLRMYEDGEFTNGNWELRDKFNLGGIEFIYDMFSKTHKIKKDYYKEGSIILIPKKW